MPFPVESIYDYHDYDDEFSWAARCFLGWGLSIGTCNALEIHGTEVVLWSHFDCPSCSFSTAPSSEYHVLGQNCNT